MLEVPFRVPASFAPPRAEKVIERIAKEHGLILSKKGPLASFPGSIHWHYKKPKQSGTLELTLWPEEKRIWAQVQAGRRAEWILEELPRLRRSIEAALRAR